MLYRSVLLYTYEYLLFDDRFFLIAEILECFSRQTSIDEEERAGCFACIVFWMSFDCKCSVALPHGAVGCSSVCDCGTF